MKTRELSEGGGKGAGGAVSVSFIHISGLAPQYLRPSLGKTYELTSMFQARREEMPCSRRLHFLSNIFNRQFLYPSPSIHPPPPLCLFFCSALLVLRSFDIDSGPRASCTRTWGLKREKLFETWSPVARVPSPPSSLRFLWTLSVRRVAIYTVQ